MSLEILLLPAGMAAAAAIRQAMDSSLCEGCKATSIGDIGILLSVLERVGASVGESTDDRVEGSISGNNFVFQKMGNAFLGKTLSQSAMTTEELIAIVQAEAGAVFQELTVQKVREQAHSLGLTLITEAQQDGEIRMVFESVSQ